MAPVADPADDHCFMQISKKVCVMDASGPFGSNVVHNLLRRGYTVHAAAQNHDELQSLKGVPLSNNKLKVFDSDPLDYQSIIEALKGCSALFYSFTPPHDHSTYDETMAEIEVKAAHNVLEACGQTQTLDRVVFTSSITAVIWGADRSHTMSSHHHHHHHLLDERNWSDVNFCKKFKLWHALSKTLAEKTAWALAMDRGVNMVSINGGFLLGSVGIDLSIKNPYLKGAAEMYEDGVFVTVDLRFMVDAHISVFEDISSYGRYLCFNHVINRNEDAIRLAYMLLAPDEASSLSLPQTPTEDERVYPQKISNRKLNMLMADFESEQASS